MLRITMLRHVALAAVCSLLLEASVFGQQSLGALRLGNGFASASARARVLANDPNNGYSYAYFDTGPNTLSGETSIDNSAAASASDGGSDATEDILVSASIQGPINVTVYVPQTALAVGHQVAADNGFGCYGCYAYAGGLGYSYGIGNANDDYLIDDQQADCPCLTGFFDLIVTTQRLNFANAGSFLDMTVDRAQIGFFQPSTYEVYWDGVLVFTITVPPGGDINMIMQIVDCNYLNPVPLLSYAGTNTGYGVATYAIAGGADSTGNQAQANISVSSWFEVEDYPCGSEPASPQMTIQHYEGEGEDRQPVGDPIDVPL